MNIYRLNEFAKKIGKSVQTLQRWDREKILIAKRTITNRRYYTHDQYLEIIGQKATLSKKTIVYYRVSSNGQKSDLINQRKAIEIFCLNAGIEVTEWLFDIGSGLNYKRKNFNNILNQVESGQVSQIIIAHKDRLVRFGFEWFQIFCENHGTRIIMMNNESLSPEQEMTKDLLSIIHCFSSRLYELRKYKKEIQHEFSIKDESDNK